MSNKQKTVVMEKDGVQAEVTRQQFRGLAKRGWTVVDDGSTDDGASQEELQQLDEQERQLFGVDDKEN